MNHSPLTDLYEIIKEVQKIMKTTPRSLWWYTLNWKFSDNDIGVFDNRFPVYNNDKLFCIFWDDEYKNKAVCIEFEEHDIFVYKSNIRSEDMPHIEKFMHVDIKDNMEMDILQMEHEIWKSTQKH